MKVCEYGCGKEAVYPPKKGRAKYCCEDDYRKCPAFIKKVANKNKGKKRNNECRNNIKKGVLGVKKTPPIKIDSNKICDFGCGGKVNYYFPITKKYCCSSNVSKCPSIRKEISNKLKGHNTSKKTRQLISKKIIEINKTNEEYRIKQSVSRKYKIQDIRRVYPFFSRIEEMRYNPDKPEEKEIQVHCKNHNCPNSKEQGGWFTPSNIQLYERIRQLEDVNGNGGCYFYCCNECKQECPLYNVKGDPLERHEKAYTSTEYETFRNYVLERDKYICQYCGKLAEHVHHERPQKLEPFHSLDPDLAWSCCKKCHRYYGHKSNTECSTGKLAAKQCGEVITT